MSAVHERLRPALEPLREAGSVHRIHPERSDAAETEFPVAEVATAFRGFLESLGLDLEDANLAGTDRRVARAYRELLAGLRRGEPEVSTFPNAKRYTGIVSVTEIPFYSICAHHFLPFFGSVHIGYVPGERLAGLSKFARVVDFYARRPQIQEDLTEQIGDLLDRHLAPTGLIVSVEARHLCMEMRGVSRPGVTTKTTAVRGTLQDDRLQRQFFERLRESRA
jgi:GTP cyclohydrolase I